MAGPALGEFSWDRVVAAVEAVRDRARRTAAALEGAGIPYAVIGGNAVAQWVARVDKSATRNTQDVDILLRRSDLPAAQAAMTAAGFIFRHVRKIDMFLDGPNSTVRDAVHILYANEHVAPDSPEPSPDLTDVEATADYKIIGLESLVRMKLISYRRKDQVHIQDMIDVGLIDATWPARFSPILADRLQALLDDPDG
jgi:hypothetical protein